MVLGILIFFFCASVFANNTTVIASATAEGAKLAKIYTPPLKAPVQETVYVCYRLDLSSQGGGFVAIDSAKATQKQFVQEATSLNIFAQDSLNKRFKQWTVTSGTCTIKDATKDTTTVTMGHEDCKIKATFVDGTTYPITTVSTQYTLEKNIFSKNTVTGISHVRFFLVAPATGNYTINVSFFALNETMVFTEYTSNEYRYVNKSAVNFNGTTSNTISLNKGDTAFVSVRGKNNKTDNVPFQINYSTTTYTLTLTNDGNGTTQPTTSKSVGAGSRASIEATAAKGYRFSKWEVTSGNPTILDPFIPTTLATINSNTAIKATFQKSEIYTLSKTDQTFSAHDNYFNESNASEVRFTWTPPDTGHYAIYISSIDPVQGTVASYGDDSSFHAVKNQLNFNGSGSILFDGNKGHPVYLDFKDNNSYSSNRFTARIVPATLLNIVTDEKGSSYPLGKKYISPYYPYSINAWPYGGYVFDSWEKISGDYTIADSKKNNTKITTSDTVCNIRASFVFDLSTQLNLEITDLDLGNLPNICTQISVTDQNNRTINALNSKNFILFEDGTPLPTQVSSVRNISGISTVLVVDASSSMGINNRMSKAKDAIRNFINEMGPYDRTAIVSFAGNDTTTVHQKMTSDKNSLLNAVNSIKADGNTNIRTGAYVGIQQISGETNPSAVIIFSDGENNRDVKTLNEVVTASKEQHTTIYSIALETSAEGELLNLSNSTGGTFTHASDASELAGIYAEIRDNIQSKYIVCYQTPDTVKNGDTHKVDIRVSLSGREASDSTEWKESFLPPEIRLTEETWDKINNPQLENVEIPLQFYITNSGAITSANVHLHTSSLTNTIFEAFPLTHLQDSLWQYTVPANKATFPGIDFYVTATDSNGLLGKSPQIPSPSKEPYTIAINNTAPQISFISATCNSDGFKKISYKVFDSDGISKILFYYKDAKASIFNEAKMVKESGSDSTWFLNVSADAEVSTGLNFYVRAIDSNGVSSRWEKEGYLTSDACISFTTPKDMPDTITIVSNDNTDSITRNTESLRLLVVTEDFSEDSDTIFASLSCKVSGDIEASIKLVETKNGFYEGVLLKDEHLPKRDDGTISCAGKDTLIAEYHDFLFGTIVYDSVYIDNFVPITYQFLDLQNNEVLDSVKTSADIDFRIRVTADDEKIHRIDTVNIILFTDAGDQLQVTAVETDTNSAIFDYIGKFTFVQDSSELATDRLDGILDLQKQINRIKIQAQVLDDTSSITSRDSLIIISNYVPADSVEIYDKDLDGKADSIRIHFKKVNVQNIVSVDTLFWNGSRQEWRSIDQDDFTISNDSSWIEAVLEEPFGYGLTKVLPDEPPYLKFQKSSTNFAQKIFISDKVGAVPVKAEKRPGETPIDDYLSNDVSIPPDTLQITLSEKIVSTSDKKPWNKLFRYSESCEDSTSEPITLETEPIVDPSGTIWELVLNNFTIPAGSCIRFDPAAAYVDMHRNCLGRGGVEILGKNSTLYIYDVKPNPAITGIGSKAEWIPPDGKQFEPVPDTISTVQVYSMSPYKASIYIYDATGQFISHFSQEFGYNGEMSDTLRSDKKNGPKIGFLYWNQHSDDDRKVGTGVFIWKIKFKFDDGYSETYTLKTGIRRKSVKE